MDSIELNQEVVMERLTLDGRPPVIIPTEYSIRRYSADDELAWARVQTAADRFNVITNELFPAAFGIDATEHCQRILFAVDSSNAVVGTSAAWYGEPPRRDWGRVHWVAVSPDHQGRGVGRALVAETLRVLEDCGHTRAYLTTSAARLPAIHLYDWAGFQPAISSDDDRRAWEAIANVLATSGTPLEHWPAVRRG